MFHYPQNRINYYPYGSEMRMTNPAQMVIESNKERFRFSGKELDFLNGLNMYDFGARFFDVAGVPVWTSVDPLAEDNSHVTPYSYCNGDPVNRLDPDGRDWYQNDYGNLYWDPEVRSQSNLQEGYRNNSYKSYFDKTGYSRQNHILTDSKGRNYSYVGHIHTHPLGADKGINEYSEDAWFAKADEGITMFIVHADGNIYQGYYSSKYHGLNTYLPPIKQKEVLKGKKILLGIAIRNKRN